MLRNSPPLLYHFAFIEKQFFSVVILLDPVTSSYRKLFERVKEIVSLQQIDLDSLKSFVERFPTYRNELELCKTIGDLFDLIRTYSSIIDVSVLDAMLKHFKIDGLDGLFESHKASVRDFCDYMVLQDASIYSFMPFYPDRQLLMVDKIEFVVDWNEHKCLGLAVALIKNAFSDLPSDMYPTIYSLSRDTLTGRVSLVCFAPHCFYRLLLEHINKNKAVFFQENSGVLSIKFGGGAHIDKEEVSNLLPMFTICQCLQFVVLVFRLVIIQHNSTNSFFLKG